MYTQLNITWFVVASIGVHAFFLVHYTRSDAAIFESRVDSVENIISRKIIQLRIMNNNEVKDISKVKVVDEKSEKRTLNTQPSKNIVNDVSEYSKKKESSSRNIIQKEQASKKSINNKNAYIKDILLEIEKNKYYPGIARKRNMQEKIAVSFSLLKTGYVTDLEIHGRFKILRHAAKSAMLKALPFNAPPPDMKLPLKVNYLMAFNLK